MKSRDRRVALGKPREGLPSTTWRSGWHYRGYLPHFDVPGLIQHVIFHLADSLPQAALERMRDELALRPRERQRVERRRRIHALLDSGHGSCVLANDACAEIVRDALLFGDGSRYRLLAWAVMPNHVHVLVEQHEQWPLAKVVQSWKRHSSRQIHRLSGSTGPLWQRDYWDRFVRNEKHFLTTRAYIENNPVAAGLVSTTEAWRWSSAWVP